MPSLRAGTPHEGLPTGAISRDVNLDIVVIEGDKCITCAMCAMVCPFNVIHYYESAAVLHDRTVALKRDHCIERQRAGEVPACVEVCKVGALQCGDINELVKSATARLAKVVSVAAGEILPELPRLPAHVEAWREYGKHVVQVNEGPQSATCTPSFPMPGNRDASSP